MNGNNENVAAADTRPDRGDSAFDPSVDPGKYAAVPTIDPNWVSLSRFKIRTAKDDNNNNTAVEYIFRNGRQQAKFYIDIEARNRNGEVVAIPSAYLFDNMKLIRRDGGAPFNFSSGSVLNYSPVPDWWPSLESYVEQSEELGAAWSVHAPDEEMEKESSATAKAPHMGEEEKPTFRWLPAEDGSYQPLQQYVIQAVTTSEIREWVAVSLRAPNGTLYTTNDAAGGTPGKFRSYVRFVTLPLYPDAIKYNYTETLLGNVWSRWRFYHYKLTIQLHGHNVPIKEVRTVGKGKPYDMWGSHSKKSHALMQCAGPGIDAFSPFDDADLQSFVNAYLVGMCPRMVTQAGAQSCLTVFCDQDFDWTNRTDLAGRLIDNFGTEHAMRIKYYDSDWWYRVEQA